MRTTLTLSRWFLLVSLVGTLVLGLSERTFAAATITVGGSCTLEEAIIAANTNNAAGACNSAVTGSFVGTDRDFILLEPNQTYTYNTAWGDPFGEGNTALPPITSTITISGNNATLVRNENLACPSATAAENFRFFTTYQESATPVELRLNELTARNGCAAGVSAAAQSGGAVRSVQSSFIMSGTQLLENQATGNGGAIASEGISSTVGAGASVIAANHSGGNGGGVYAAGSGGMVTVTVYLGATALDGNSSQGKGGGVFITNSATITSFTLLSLGGGHTYSNTSQGDGGGAFVFAKGTDAIVIATVGSQNVMTNTSQQGKGGGLYLENAGTHFAVTNLSVGGQKTNNNTSQGDGGGLYVKSAGSQSILNISLGGANLDANTSQQGKGGGLYIESTDPDSLTALLALGGMTVYTNTSQGDGGAIYTDFGGDNVISNVSLGSVLMNANTSRQGKGGAFYLESSDATSLFTTFIVGGGSVYTNASAGDGGGIYAHFAANYITSTVNFGGTSLNWNSSQQGKGGGVYFEQGGIASVATSLSLGGTNFYTNTSAGDGGGLYALNTGDIVTANVNLGGGGLKWNTSQQGKGGALYLENAGASSTGTNLSLGGVQVYTNTSESDGGGVYITDGGAFRAFTSALGGNQFYGNRSQGNGGALSISTPVTDALVFNSNQFLYNVADQGGALYAATEGGSGQGNCIVGNYEDAVIYTGTQVMTTTNNWWGSSSGPGGDFPGSGDKAFGNLNVSDFYTSTFSGCPTLVPTIAVAPYLNPDFADPTPLLPGQPVTFTGFITNTGPLVIHTAIHTQTITSDYGLALTNDAFENEIAPAEDRSLVQGLVVPSDITANKTITFSYAVTASGDTPTFATITNTKSVSLPTVALTATTINVDESSDLPVGVKLDVANPYTDSIVTLQTSDGSAIAGADYTAINQQFVIPAGQSSILVPIPIDDDTVIEGNETFVVSLSVNGGLFLGTPYTATVTISEQLPDAELVMTKTVGIDGITPACTGLTNRTVPVSTTVIYCYTVTNTGSEPLTNHSVHDSVLGNVPVNSSFVLQAGQSFSTTITQTLTVSTTNIATWTAQLADVSTTALIDEVTVATTGAATVTIAAANSDQDADTIPDNIESAGDVDNDNVPNFLDTDADGDNRPDQEEAGPDPLNPIDSNNNGIPDFLDPSGPTALDPDAQPQQQQRLLLPSIQGH